MCEHVPWCVHLIGARPPWDVHLICAQPQWDVHAIVRIPHRMSRWSVCIPTTWPRDQNSWYRIVYKSKSILTGELWMKKWLNMKPETCWFRCISSICLQIIVLSVKIFQLSLLLFRCRLIQDKDVDLVVNLPNQNTKYIKDNYLIRRSSIDCGVPLITNLEV